MMILSISALEHIDNYSKLQFTHDINNLLIKNNFPVVLIMSDKGDIVIGQS